MPKDSPEHPYKKYEDTDLWENIKQSIKDLEENQDIKNPPPEGVVLC